MKKSEFLSVRVDGDTKDYLKKIADERKWTVSLLVSEIIKEWIQEKEK